MERTVTKGGVLVMPWVLKLVPLVPLVFLMVEPVFGAVAAAKGRLRVMACGGLHPDNIAAIYRQTHVDDVHFAAPRRVDSGMRYRNVGVTMGGETAEAEYSLEVTDAEMVRATIAALRTAL